MANPAEYFDKADAVLAQANEAEAQQDYQKAFNLMLEATDWLKQGIKYSSHERMMPIYRQKLMNAVDRAEELKMILDARQRQGQLQRSDSMRDKYLGPGASGKAEQAWTGADSQKAGQGAAGSMLRSDNCALALTAHEDDLNRR